MNEREVIELNVLINFREYLRLSYLLTFRRLRFFWLFFLILALYDFYIYFQTNDVYGLLFSLLSMIVVIPFFAVLVYWTVWRNIKTLKTLNENVNYSFSVNEIKANGASWNSNADWSMVLKAQEVGGFILLFTSNMTSYLLPLRCFDDRKQLVEFRALVQTKLGRRAKLKKPVRRLGLK